MKGIICIELGEPSKDDILKHWLTTEMGRTTRLPEWWHNDRPDYKNAIKLIYCPGGWRGLDNVGTTKVCLALQQEMELLGCYINFNINQIFG